MCVRTPPADLPAKGERAAELATMMDELPVPMQCGVCEAEQMSEEEILACLVADTEPKFPVRLSSDIRCLDFSGH